VFFSTVATAKQKTVATAKIKGILWGAVAKATQSPAAALFFVLRRPIEQVSWMLGLRGSCGHQLLLLSLNERLLRLEKSSRNIMRYLLLSLKLRGSAAGSRCRMSGEISGGVTHISGDA
jgi:hypothetical protein